MDDFNKDEMKTSAACKLQEIPSGAENYPENGAVAKLAPANYGTLLTLDASTPPPPPKALLQGSDKEEMVVDNNNHKGEVSQTNLWSPDYIDKAGDKLQAAVKHHVAHTKTLLDAMKAFVKESTLVHKEWSALQAAEDVESARLDDVEQDINKATNSSE
jgi:hypothetical protein